MSVAETFDSNAQRKPAWTGQTPAALTKTDTPKAAPANQNTDQVSVRTWIAVIGATLGAFDVPARGQDLDRQHLTLLREHALRKLSLQAI